MPLKVHPDIASLVPYVPGKPIEELQRELGLARAIKLASNENPIGPSPKALAVLGDTASTLHRYPDGGAFRLRGALAERCKVTPDQVILGNGSDELLGLLARTFLSPGDEAVMAEHTFVIYKMEVKAAHGVAVEVPQKNWHHDLPAMADAITDNTRLLFICNPNNPTGTMATKAEVAALMARVPEQVVVVFDEAYYEYVRHPEFPESLGYVKAGRNVIVLRTFSKIYGLAGLRIGYGITTPEITNYLNRIRPPFNANSMAQRAALAALDDDSHVGTSRALNHAEMDKVRAGLRRLGFEALPSETNFLYFDVGRDGREVFDALLRKGIIVRHIDGQMLRVTIGLPEENHLFLSALEDVTRAPR
ncbi:MAG: histidinol-phosphate transaminase [Nitrospira sp.]|jgi:histidinol-phosphate aminotransferase|nr:histidinol-phosphate transaminase [Nitrospira sp.]MBP6606017.1 histidinol-phosphate transaminase [Nitrospira sp.]MCI1277588.1 histidinol-phosphate transaminase [Nitrospira sp.]HQY56222.1 histidinol-phosphate transaminase [Nitrospira sp.]HRA95645.1 histidinol-phosphate transaminase [Nitrospira sp.]